MTESNKSTIPGFEAFTDPMRQKRVVICPQATVVYTLAEQDDPRSLLKHHLHPTDKDQQIRDILAANPKAEFTPELQSALGITIVSIQKTPQPSSTGWDVGF